MSEIHDHRFGPLLQKAIVLVIKDEINLLRALHELPERTNGQIETAVENKFIELGGE